MLRTAAPTAVLTLMIAACGGGGSHTVTVTSTAATPSPQRTTTPAPAQSRPTPSGCSGGSCAHTATEAAAIVKAQGFDAVASSFRPGAALTAVVGIRTGSQDGTAQRAFFFQDGRYIGTDTADESAGIKVSAQSGDTVTLVYRLYAPHDPQCCSTAGTATVRFRWDGSRLVPQDPIPPSGYYAAGSRR